MKQAMLIVALVASACSEDVPSCQEAVTNFYSAGCTFADLSTTPPTPYSLSESIVSCKEVNAAVPDRCQSYFDDYMLCLDSVDGTAQCTSCTQEQDALFGCQ